MKLASISLELGLHRAGRVVLLAAVFANPVNLKRVASREIAIFAADVLLQVIHLLREKLDRAAALGADHVVMAATVILMLVAGNAVVESDLAGESAFGQQLQSAVDRGISDALIFLLHQAMKLVGREMIAGLEKGPKDGVTLCGLLQSHSLEVAVQNFLGFADHLT